MISDFWCGYIQFKKQPSFILKKTLSRYAPQFISPCKSHPFQPNKNEFNFIISKIFILVTANFFTKSLNAGYIYDEKFKIAILLQRIYVSKLTHMSRYR